jgi:ABC-type branched-subunit amino acid transport system permease subunit
MIVMGVVFIATMLWTPKGILGMIRQISLGKRKSPAS